MRRAGLLLVAAACFLLAFERPAAAHGAGGIVATNFETTVGGVAPALAGVRVRAIEAGTRLELRNAGAEVVVLGDQHEPYLRVGPGGSFENRRSPTAARNRQQTPGSPAVGEGDPSAPPDWRKLSDAALVRWNPRSIHWTDPRNPPEVVSSPGLRHVVLPRWEIELVRGSQRAVVFGQLTWVPGPSPAPWFGVLAGSFVGVGALGLLRHWGRPLAAVTAVVLAVDVVHALSVAFAFAGGLATHLGKLVTGGFYGIVGWGLAVLAIRLLRRGKVDGLYAGVFAGLSMAVFGGLLDLAKLSRSVSLSTLPLGIARLCVAVSAGAGLGLAAACLLVIQRTPDARRVVGAGGGSRESPGRDGGADADDPGGTPAGPDAPGPAPGEDVLGAGSRSGPPA
jgi:hypothetical protein